MRELPSPDIGYGIRMASMATTDWIERAADWPRIKAILVAEAALTGRPTAIGELDIPYYKFTVCTYAPYPIPPDDVRWAALWYKETQFLKVGKHVLKGRTIILFSTYGANPETVIYVGTKDGDWKACRRAGSSFDLKAWGDALQDWLNEHMAGGG